MTDCGAMTRQRLIAALSRLKPTIIDSCTSALSANTREACAKRVTRLLDYTVGDGKLLRGSLLLNSYDALVTSPSSSSSYDVTMEQVETLASCVEILQSFFLVIDDVMDGSETRRGKLCWYKTDGIGLSGVNDALLLETSADTLVHQAFVASTLYTAISTSLLTMKRLTLMGQMLDLETKDIDNYDEDRYTEIVRLKTSHYSIYFPIELALILQSNRTPSPIVKDICYRLGHYFQVQDDYLDVYGDATETGKVGTDIVDGKCAWPIVTALPLAKRHTNSDALYRTLKHNYGRGVDDGSVGRVREAFSTLSIESEYERFETDQRRTLTTLIDRHCDVEQLKPVFRAVLDTFHKRLK